MRRLTLPEEERQIPLTPGLHYAKQGARIRALLNRTMQVAGVSCVDLETDTEIDEKQIGRALKDDGGAHPPLALIACILAKDRAGTFITGLADMLGYEARPKAPDLAEENRRLREQLAEIKALIAKIEGAS